MLTPAPSLPLPIALMLLGTGIALLHPREVGAICRGEEGEEEDETYGGGQDEQRVEVHRQVAVREEQSHELIQQTSRDVFRSELIEKGIVFSCTPND